MSELALQLIAEAKENKSTFLDLGNCGLTEVPKELYELTWLENLNLGTHFHDRYRKKTQNKGSTNQLKKIPDQLSIFEKLKVLSLDDNQISKLEGLSGLENLSVLYLDSNQISKLEGLSGLENLSELYLSSNQISKLEGLSALQNLSRLYLSSNQISKLEGLSALQNLSRLYLSSNQISKLEGLSGLENLSELYLSSNQISKLEGLSALQNLSRLYLDSNQISKLEGLSGLENLSELYLSSNQISKLEGLSGLENLSVLYLYSNQISKLEGLSGLENLSELYLSSNQISKLEGLSALQNLSLLSLSSNQISKLEGLSALKNLSRLYLDSNQITDEGISQEFIDTFKDKGLFLDLSDNPIKLIKLEQGKNHFPALENYFAQKAEEDLIPVQLPQKVLLLGNHAAGKSSLLNYLDKGKIREKQDSTHILQIVDYGQTDQELPKAIFYDFGGQDFYHGLYRVFLSNQAIHLLLWHPNSNENKVQKDSNKQETHHFSLTYWQGQKKFMESKNGVEADESVIIRTHLDDELPLAGEPNSDFKLSLASDVKMKEFSKGKIGTITLGRQYFRATLDELIDEQSRKDDLPAWYIEFMKFLFDYETEEPQTPVRLSEIKKKHYRREEKNREKLEEYFRQDLRQFHLSGILLFYPDIPEIADVAWLDPQGLVQYVHDEILTKEIVSRGKVVKDDFDIISKDLLTLLLAQKVIFLDTADEQYIVPNYLPLANEEDPDYQLLTFGMDRPDFVLQFDEFIPFGLINQLICFFGDNPDKKKFWRNQLLFTLSKKARIMIKLDFEKLQIVVFHQILKAEKILKPAILKRYLFLTIMAMYWDRKCVSLDEFVDPDSEKNRRLGNESDEDTGNPKSKLLRDHLDVVVKRNLREEIFRMLQDKPLAMRISLDGQYFVSYQDLSEKKERIVKGFALDDSQKPNEQVYQNIDKSQFNAFMEKPVTAPKKIFISYSKRDSTYKEQLLVHLSKMQREGLIDIWHDRMIELGEWDVQIKNELKNSDIVICLVSQNFFDSQYIWDNELNASLARAEKGECKIIPVLIRDCDWESWKKFGDNEKATQAPEPDMKINQLQFYPYYDYEIRGEINRKLRAIATWPHGEEPFMQVVKAIRKEIGA